MPDWNGNYRRDATKTATWYHGAVLQIPTYLTLLTPEYQTRYVQQMYHYAATNAPQWPASYCEPEGFMRRIAQYSGFAPSVMMTPELFQVLNVTAGNFITHVLIGRKFNEDGSVPYLSADVRRWYGETIGFWDGEALVTWTSNIQGWMAHGAFEFSSEMQSIEIYTPRKDARGAVNGIDHEVILYDPEALVEPVRIVHGWTKASKAQRRLPYLYIECVRYNYPMNGRPRRCRPARRSNTPSRTFTTGPGRKFGSAISSKAWSIPSRRRCSDSNDGDPRAETVCFDRRRSRRSQRGSRQRWPGPRTRTIRLRCTTRRRPMCSPGSSRA